MDPALPRIIGGYRLLRPLGKGGGGLVFLAQQENLRRQVALKVLRDVDPDDATLRRFHREAQVAAQLSHPGLAKIYDSGTDGELHYIAMEVVHGRTLAAIIDERGPLPIPEATPLLVQVLEALAVCHQARLIHRDIKPSNVMVEPSGRARLLDLGLARVIDRTALTEPGLVVGTPVFLSPEVVVGDPATPASDLYQVGLLLHTSLTGQLPYAAKSIAELFAQITAGPPALRPDLPPALRAFLHRMLARHPEDRFESCTVALHALRAVESAPETQPPRPLSGEDQVTRALEPPVPVRAARRLPAHPILLVTLLTSALAGAILKSLSPGPRLAPAPLPIVAHGEAGWEVQWTTEAAGRGRVEVAPQPHGPWRRGGDEPGPTRHHRVAFTTWPAVGQALWFRVRLDGGSASAAHPLEVPGDTTPRLVSVTVEPRRAVLRFRTAAALACTLTARPGGAAVRDFAPCQSHELAIGLAPGSTCTLDLESGKKTLLQQRVSLPSVEEVLGRIVRIVNGLKSEPWLEGLRHELLGPRRREAGDRWAQRARAHLARAEFDAAVADYARVRDLTRDPLALSVAARGQFITSVHDLLDLHHGLTGLSGRDAGLDRADLHGPGIDSSGARPSGTLPFLALELGDGGSGVGRLPVPAAWHPVRRLQPDPFRRGAEEFLLGRGPAEFPARWEIVLAPPLPRPGSGLVLCAFRLHGGRDWDRLDVHVGTAPGTPPENRVASLRARGPGVTVTGVIEVDPRSFTDPGAHLTVTYPNGADHRGIESIAVLDHLAFYTVPAVR